MRVAAPGTRLVLQPTNSGEASTLVEAHEALRPVVASDDHPLMAWWTVDVPARFDDPLRTGAYKALVLSWGGLS